LILPEVLEPIRRECSVPRRVLDVLMPEIRLERARIAAVVCVLVTTGVAKHVGMGLDPEFRGKSGPFDHPGKAWRRKRRTTFRDEHERRFHTFAVMAAERSRFTACQWMCGGRAILDP